MIEETIYVADTHSLVWYFHEPSKLSPAANEAFERVEKGKAKLIIPIIVIAELIFLVEKKRVSADVENIITQINESDNFRISSLELEQVLLLKKHTTITEMHDRMIVCEALISDAKLITKDRNIRNAGVVEVIW